MYDRLNMGEDGTNEVWVEIPQHVSLGTNCNEYRSKGSNTEACLEVHKEETKLIF